MSSFLWHTIADTEANKLRIPDEDNNDLWQPRSGYSYQMRGARSNRDHGNWRALWPVSRLMSGDPGEVAILGMDASEGGRFEPISVLEGGSSRLYFIHGVCVDGSSNPLGGAVLDLFLTASDVWVSTGGTDSNGIYSLGTPYIGENHYIVANYGPNTLVGASVNTLQPVLSPW